MPRVAEFEAWLLPEEVTDVEELAAADWPNRAASWDLVRQSGEESVGLSVMQSCSVLTLPKFPTAAKRSVMPLVAEPSQAMRLVWKVPVIFAMS